MARKQTDNDDAQDDVPAAERKPWQVEDYTGPLTADQAAWRHANIKPVVEDTKPARDVITK